MRKLWLSWLAMPFFLAFVACANNPKPGQIPTECLGATSTDDLAACVLAHFVATPASRPSPTATDCPVPCAFGPNECDTAGPCPTEPRPTASPRPTPTSTAIAIATPEKCPCLRRVGFSQYGQDWPNGAMTCKTFDATPRFGPSSNGLPCNSEHHAVCSASGNDTGDDWRKCEFGDPSTGDEVPPSWIQSGAVYSKARGYKFDVCVRPGRKVTITAGPPPSPFDQLRKALPICPGTDGRTSTVVTF